MSGADRTGEYWRSAGGRCEAGSDPAASNAHPPVNDPSVVEAGKLNRRKFLALAGVSAAVAGGGLAGCIRKPVENIMPYSRRPEDLIPGKPRLYATAAQIGHGVLGLLVESQDGRPTKIEGNPRHPMSLGATSAWAQAEIMQLYDPDRSRVPLRAGKPQTWQAFRDQIAPALEPARRERGAGLALLLEPRPSPTLRRLLNELRTSLPACRLFEQDGAYGRNAARGRSLVGLEPRTPVLELDLADVIVSLDCDLLGVEGDSVRNARLFAGRREARDGAGGMSRLYVVEPALTVTGGMADNRLRLAGSRVPSLLRALAARVLEAAPVAADGAGEVARALAAEPRGGFGRWVDAMAADLLAHRGASLVVVGERQPLEAHALALLLNVALENLGRTLHLPVDPDALDAEPVEALARAIEAGQVSTLVTLGGNPAFDAPADLGLASLLARVPLGVHLGSHLDETSSLATWHLPRSHFLEAWGDLRASDGTVSVQQPLIAPLFDTISEIELVALLGGAVNARGYEIVRRTWSAVLGADGAALEARWRRWLRDGVADVARPEPTAPRWSWRALAEALGRPEPKGGDDTLELDLRLDASVLDGRYANNGWLQELPDPVTKLTWDNAALMGPQTARRLGLESGDRVALELAGRSVQAPVFVVPGTADGVVVAPLGYGRRAGGAIAVGTGFDAQVLRTARAPWFAPGLSVRRIDGRHAFATTQEHGRMEGRPIVREATLEQFLAHPSLASGHGEGHSPRSLWKEPNERGGQQWGMSIDLGKCLGCNACVLACQAENNIPVVGKQRVAEGREMHWLRIDRYFEGPEDDPRMVSQPMACVQCENAPCESVCPVAATSHSPEGLNDQAYQRCIGTRYCSNNCPYKVRRFNFFQYNKDLDPLVRMQKNPDVTLRFRGVMEKCTYCVQRINEAKIAAKVRGDGVVRDGAVVTACQQACPSQAIVFGDVNDAASAVARRKRDPRDYAVLGELNVRPRTSYLARIRNPNPALTQEG
jgi:molybdopterin-containing oxidoreductase family iron-sulfur binding subunit